MDDHTTYIKSYIAGYEEVWVVQNLIENQCSHYMCQMENNCNKPTLTTLLPLLGKECDGKNRGAYVEQKLSARPAGPALIGTCLSMFFLGCSRCDSMYNTCGFVFFFVPPNPLINHYRLYSIVGSGPLVPHPVRWVAHKYEN